MAQRDLSAHQEKIVKRYYEHRDTLQSQKLQDLVGALWLVEDEKKATRMWGQAQVALMRLGVDANRVAAVVGARDLERLARLVTEADAGRAQGQGQGGEPGTTRGGRPALPGAADGRTVGEARAEAQAADGRDSLEPDNLKRAMQAFRRKLRSLRLDDESKLGGRYTSAGKSSGIAAITPPREFPARVWQELAAQGKLRSAGGGTYRER